MKELENRFCRCLHFLFLDGTNICRFLPILRPSTVPRRLEMKKYRDCLQKPEMHYWQNTEKGSNAEVDYLKTRDGKVLPVEVKANTQGSMQSLWIFMRKRQLHEAIRTSLENFGQFDHYDPKDNFEQRHVDIVPLYALSNIRCLHLKQTEQRQARHTTEEQNRNGCH